MINKMWEKQVAISAVQCFASLFCISNAFAGTQQGQVVELIVRASDGLVYFGLTGAGSSKPACATQGYWIIKNENSTAGKQQLAQLLLAQKTNSIVYVTGSNTCSRWADGEDVLEVHTYQAK